MMLTWALFVVWYRRWLVGIGNQKGMQGNSLTSVMRRTIRIRKEQSPVGLKKKIKVEERRRRGRKCIRAKRERESAGSNPSDSTSGFGNQTDIREYIEIGNAQCGIYLCWFRLLASVLLLLNKTSLFDEWRLLFCCNVRRPGRLYIRRQTLFDERQQVLFASYKILQTKR